MSESTKAVLGAVAFLSIVIGLMCWIVGQGAAYPPPTTPVVWLLRFLLPIIGVAAGYILYLENMRKDLEPDFVRAIFRTPFERDGVCFSIIPTSRNGTCFLNVVFQNQYSSPCRFRVVVSPPGKSFLGAYLFPGTTLDINCEGAAVGVASAPMSIPKTYLGQPTRFEIGAATIYPEGRGKLLRFRNGMRVGEADQSGLAEIGKTVALMAIGVAVVRKSTPAGFVFTPPVGVAESVDPSIRPSVKVIWRIGDPADAVVETLKSNLSVF